MDEQERIQPAAGDTELPPTTLIIPSRNRPDLLVATVEAVLRGDAVPTELVIVDQSDEPNRRLSTYTTARTCDLRYIWTRTRGVSQARNIGITKGRYDLLVFIDDDIIVAPRWFATIVMAQVNAGPRTALTGRVLELPADTPGGFAPSTVTDEAPALYEGRVHKDVLYSNNMAMYRFAIEQVGLFDTRLGTGAAFPAATDNDYGFLLLEAGFRILYDPAVTVYHRAWRQKDGYVPLRWNYGVGRGAFYAKHLSVHDRYMLWRLLDDIRVHGLRSLQRLPRQPRHAYADAVFAIALMTGAIKWLLTQPRHGSTSAVD